MSPEYIVGSIVTESGPQPFVLHTQTGKFTVGDYVKLDEAQQGLSIIQQQRFIQLVAERVGLSFAQVRLGHYHCTVCGNWVEATPRQWGVSTCLSCSTDHAIEPNEHIEEAGPAAAEASVAAPVVEEEPADAPAPASEEAAPEAAPVVEEEPADAPAPALEAVVPEAALLETETPEAAVIDALLLLDEAMMLEKAVRLAVEAHSGQRDKAGAPYVLHPLRMMFRLDTPAEKMVALLHDVVEDTAWTLEALRREGFSEEIVAAVDCMTRQEDESYDAFIERAAQNPLARRVKLADLEDNMDVRRLDALTPEDQARLARYLKTWRRLKGF